MANKVEGEATGGGRTVLPYARIPEEPRVVLTGRFGALATTVINWVKSDDDRDRLRVAAIWGGRGTGKSSMLLTVLDLLRKPSEPPAPGKTPKTVLLLPAQPSPCGGAVPWELFEPSKVVYGDRLFIHLLDFLQRRYFPGRPGHPDRPFSKTMELEAKAVDPKRFLDYEKETATSKEKLNASTIDFYRQMGARSTIISEDISKSLAALAGRLVLFVDDLDLHPQHAHDLLEILHTYFRDANITVLLAADPVQLLASIDHSLRERKISTAGLGSQLLAKYITAEWRLPIPDLVERKHELHQPKQEHRSGFRSFDFNGWWSDFRAPPARDQATDSTISSARRTKEPNAGTGGTGTSPDDVAKKFFIEASPWTWRGLNRLRNRAIALEEEHKDVKNLAAKYQRAVGSSLGNVASFLAILLAIDESFPELMVFESFEDQPDRLRAGLGAAIPPTIESAQADARKGDTKDAKRDTDRWSIDDPKEAKLFPVRDRLLDDSIISGQRRGRAERVLLGLGTLWRDVWAASSSREEGGASFLAISVYDDARAKSQPWWERMQLADDAVSNIDLRSSVSTPRPTTAEMSALCGFLAEEYGELLKRGQQQIFAMVPLSVAAWIGWYGRYVQGLKVVGYDRETDFQVFSPTGASEEPEPRLIFFAEPLLRPPTEPGDASSRDAAVVLDVRSNPDQSPSALPFRNEGAQAVRFSQYVKLVSEKGFRLEDDGQVAQIIHDLRLVFGDLRHNHGIQRIHLAFACPSALAILVGRELHPWSPVLLYEYVPNAELGPSYAYVITLG